MKSEINKSKYKWCECQTKGITKGKHNLMKKNCGEYCLRYRLVKLEMSEQIDDEIIKTVLYGLNRYIESVGLETFFLEYDAQPETTKLIVEVCIDLAMQTK